MDSDVEKVGTGDEMRSYPGLPVELIPLIQTNPKTGLDSYEAQERLEAFGKNEIVEKKRNLFMHFLSFFTGSIAYLIMIALILTGITRDWVNFIIIALLLFINAFIGWFEDSKAESAVDSLKNTLAIVSKVWRDGEIAQINSNMLVPGDIIILRLGDIVPADALLLGITADGNPTDLNLLVDQSSLTGESLPVTKSKSDMVYSSSIVKQGQMMAVVTHTGLNTFIGKAADLISITNEQGHFQKIINQIGNFLVTITIAMVLVIFVFLFIKRKNLNPEMSNDEIMLKSLGDVVVLTVAAIPVGLPTVLSVTMAIGSKMLASKNVIVKRLTAVEEMASISVLCSDKTGTLTLNNLSFDEPFLKEGYSENDLLMYAFMASENGASDPIEVAIRKAAITRVDLLKNSINNNIPGYKISAFVPFNPSTKMTKADVISIQDNFSFSVCKGAPQVIIGLCGGDSEAESAVNQFAARGLRALGVAIKSATTGNAWKMVGLVSLLDPPRADSAETIARCQNLGISVKMITGDQQVIAKEVAYRLGMYQNILSASQLNNSKISDDKLGDLCLHSDGFAQVVPEDKYRIIELIQSKNVMVGMTGDGVNDAPALKKADVGIAVHGSTDAARAAADIVLLESGLSAIIDGVTISRAIFQRMRSYALYRITSTVHFLIFFFIITLQFSWQMSPLLLILIAVLNDAATIVIAFDNAQVAESPTKWRIGQIITLSIIIGILLFLLTYAVFFVARDVYNIPVISSLSPNSHNGDNRMQSIIYLNISSAPHFVIFSTRINGYFFENLPSLTFFVAVMATQVFAAAICSFGIPNLVEKIGFGWGASLLLISLIYFVVLDAVKVYIIRLWNFKLVATLWPSRSNKQKLLKRQDREIARARIARNVSRIRNIVEKSKYRL
ncbi:hypothetical protein BB561_005868 [Smittium simulii]|uniref:Plasma membrane ATPase n=1 Tax=Smittium simulii TaxID=133385 RepID=A0A2T9Y7W4_9FUNG|nr:hypothetical protein BB561_005868 [Smittium simulii]